VDAVQLPVHLADFDCRNNRLALLGLMQDGFAEAVRPPSQNMVRSASACSSVPAHPAFCKPSWPTGAATR